LKPFYQDNESNITIYHADALAVLAMMPNESVDALITDPPYSSGGFTRGDRTMDPAAKYVQSGTDVSRISFTGDNRDQRSWAYWCSLWLGECTRVVKLGGYAMMFTDWRQLPAATDAFQAGGFVWRGIVSWDKGLGSRAPHTGYFRHQCEYIVWGSNGPLGSCKHAGPFAGSIIQNVVQADKVHMTGKPVQTMEKLVAPVPPLGVVVDPFMGSGSTAVACKAIGRGFIGVERELENCKIAVDRLRQEVLPMGSTRKSTAKVEQMSLTIPEPAEEVA
jgi:site-specific DNA-methyltransferase (adenine-specific)